MIHNQFQRTNSELLWQMMLPRWLSHMVLFIGSFGLEMPIFCVPCNNSVFSTLFSIFSTENVIIYIMHHDIIWPSHKDMIYVC